MSWRPKWQNFGKRRWEDIRGSWLANVPAFPAVGAPASPGLVGLPALLPIAPPDNHERFADVEGLRLTALWEAIFLFQKCAHTSLATQRIGRAGMHSWSLFNAYHSAYLGARGLMTLLGVPLLIHSGIQIAIDLFPEQQKRRRSISLVPFEDFVVVRLPGILEQRHLWEGFLRVLRMSEASCWDHGVRDDLLALSYERITPPRNQFLYLSQFWPLNDLMIDGQTFEFNQLIGRELDTAENGFLLRLCFSVYRLFEQLLTDLAVYSGAVREQLEGSRVQSILHEPELECYSTFLSSPAL